MTLLAEIVFEILAYCAGKAVATVLLPHLKIDTLSKQQSEPQGRWWAFTYVRGGHRYLYTKSIQAIGVVTLLLAGFGPAMVLRHAS